MVRYINSVLCRLGHVCVCWGGNQMISWIVHTVSLGIEESYLTNEFVCLFVF